MHQIADLGEQRSRCERVSVGKDILAAGVTIELDCATHNPSARIKIELALRNAQALSPCLAGADPGESDGSQQ